MSTRMTRAMAQSVIADRHDAAARTCAMRAQAASPSRLRAMDRIRLGGPIAVVAALAMLLVSIPMLSAAPANASAAPMPTPTPGAIPSLER